MPKIDRGIAALAFACQEGWNDPPRSPNPLIPHRCLNPGNLRWAPSRFPQSGMDHGYVIFASKEAGWGALDNDLNAKALHGLTLADAIRIYCPVGDGANDPDVYVKNVSDHLGVDPSQRMLDLFTGPIHVPGPWSLAPDMGPPRPNWEDLNSLLSLFAR